MFAFLLTGRDSRVSLQWESLLTRLGIIFQMKDDYEGTFADEKKTGKSPLSDTQEGKNTSIVELFRSRASATELSRFQTFFSTSTLSLTDFNWYLNLLKEQGVHGEIRTHIQTECAALMVLLEKYGPTAQPLQTVVRELIMSISTF
jgi:geranylgeranyl pyrophosphate synthase